MKTAGSTERPASAISIQRSSRQRLQLSNSRRVYAVENGLGAASSELGLHTEDLTKKTDTTAVSSSEAKAIIKATQDKKQQDPDDLPLKNLVFKTANQKVVQVAIRCIFLRVGDIDTLNERYYAEALLEASWIETSFKGLTQTAFDPNIHWTPQLELMNGIGDLQDEVTYTVRFDKQGVATVTEHHKLKGTLWERMELQHFPLDVQDLSISITTSRTNLDMIFVQNLKKPSGVNRRIFTDEQEWYLFEHVDIEITEQIDEYIDDIHNHSIVVCSCHAARKYGYFMWNAYFLVFLITSASFTTFPIPLANIQGRVQIGCTLLLTSITFRWACNKGLPTISYLTAVDIYAIGSIFSLCLLNIYHGVIGYLNFYIASTGSTTTSTASNTSIATTTTATATTSTTSSTSSIIVIDRWALVVSTILFFAYQIVTALWMYLVPWKKRRTMFKKDSQYRLEILSQYNHGNTIMNDAFQANPKK